jgi:hypothetical protein
VGVKDVFTFEDAIFVNPDPLPANERAVNAPPTLKPSVVLIAHELPTPHRKHSAPLSEFSVLPADDVDLTLAVLTTLLSADNAGARCGSVSAVNHAWCGATTHPFVSERTNQSRCAETVHPLVIACVT